MFTVIPVNPRTYSYVYFISRRFRTSVLMPFICYSFRIHHSITPRVWHVDFAQFIRQRASGKTYDDIADGMGLTNAYVAQVQREKRLDALHWTGCLLCHRSYNIFSDALIEQLAGLFVAGVGVITIGTVEGLPP